MITKNHYTKCCVWSRVGPGAGSKGWFLSVVSVSVWLLLAWLDERPEGGRQQRLWRKAPQNYKMLRYNNYNRRIRKRDNDERYNKKTATAASAELPQTGFVFFSTVQYPQKQQNTTHRGMISTWMWTWSHFLAVQFTWGKYNYCSQEVALLVISRKYLY